MKFRSRLCDWDMRELKEKNKLYEIVSLYGGYLWYKENVDEGTYTAFFNIKKDTMNYIFVNTANTKLREYFLGEGLVISSNKMRKLIATSRKSVVRSYGWINMYLDYILKECLKVEELKEYIFHYILVECYCHKDKSEIEKCIRDCMEMILGFQYILLDNIAHREESKTTSCAKKCLETIKSSMELRRIFSDCPYCK